MKSISKLILINLPLSFVCDTHTKWETIDSVFIRNIKWTREIEWRLKTEHYMKSHVFYSSLLICWMILNHILPEGESVLWLRVSRFKGALFCGRSISSGAPKIDVSAGDVCFPGCSMCRFANMLRTEKHVSMLVYNIWHVLCLAFN